MPYRSEQRRISSQTFKSLFPPVLDRDEATRFFRRPPLRACFAANHLLKERLNMDAATAPHAPGLDGSSAEASLQTRLTHSDRSNSSSSSLSDHSVLVSVLRATPAAQTPAVTAADASEAAPEPAAAPARRRSWQWNAVNYLLIPLALPLLALYWLVALLLGVAASWMVWPSLLLAQRLYWACPFIPFIWRSPAIRSKFGVVGSWVLRLQFEGAHCATVVSRLLTLPMRPHLPSFYLLGFPVSCAEGVPGVVMWAWSAA